MRSGLPPSRRYPELGVRESLRTGAVRVNVSGYGDGNYAKNESDRTGCVTLAWSATSFAGQAAYCAAEADRASRGSGSPMGGLARGAAKGALFGAIVGNSKGAGRGAALGALVGGVRQGTYKNNVYESVYDACMRRY